jgi:hypothetical protein
VTPKAAWIATVSLLSAVVSCSVAKDIREQHAAGLPPRTEEIGNIGSTLTISTHTVTGWGKVDAGTADFTVANHQTIEGSNGPLLGTTAHSFDVTVIGKDGTVFVNPFFFAANTDDGATLLTNTKLSEHVVGVIELTRGQERSGRIYFDVPFATEIKDIVLTEGLTGPTLGKWMVTKPLPEPTFGRAVE